jgi:flagellar protein FliO/FliZ
MLAEAAAAAEGTGFEAVSSGKLLETLLGLLLVLALIFALARLLQRMQGSVSGGDQIMRVVSSLNVGARERVLLLKVSDKHILIAASANAISPLHVFDDLPPEYGEAPQQAAGFGNLLQALKRGGPQ